MALSSNARANIGLGFWIGVGLLLLGLVLTILQVVLGKVASRG